jgi:hypothetical protein
VTLMPEAITRASLCREADSARPKREAASRRNNSSVSSSSATASVWNATWLESALVPNSAGRSSGAPLSPPNSASAPATKYAICANASVIMMKVTPRVRSATAPVANAKLPADSIATGTDSDASPHPAAPRISGV